MFFVTIKFNKRAAVSIILAIAAILIALIIIFSRENAESVFKSSDLGTKEARIEYLNSIGWQAEPESETEKTVLIPREFTGVYQSYNELQKQQGFDLENFCGTEVQMYSYIITNYKSTETVVATIYTHNGRLIAGDIHSTTLNGFMHALK